MTKHELRSLISNVESIEKLPFIVPDLGPWQGEELETLWYNQFARSLAELYHNKELDYGLANRIANELWQDVTARFSEYSESTKKVPIPEAVSIVYEAFDLGEERFLHEPDWQISANELTHGIISSFLRQ